MLKDIDLMSILFIDIETVPQCESYALLSDPLKRLWDKKAKYIRDNEEEDPGVTYRRAGIYAEFGKIVCISAGFFSDPEFRIKSFFGDDERSILQDFSVLLSKFFGKRENHLCAHNGKEFDFPYIARRMLINGVDLPDILDHAGKKPWEVNHLDTMELWKFGDHKSYTSLELLANIFGIANPKDDMDGSEVGGVYWIDKDLPKIATYCQKDVLTAAQLLLKYQGKQLIPEGSVVYL
jgi:3'-5' exonuclease